MTSGVERPDVHHLLELAFAAQRAHASVQHRARELLHRLGLTLARFRVLSEIERCAGAPPSVRTLAQRLELHRTSVRATIHVLENFDFIQCKRDAADARRISIVLTPSGRAALASARESLLELDEAMPAGDLGSLDVDSECGGRSHRPSGGILVRYPGH
jgi:DNA-binding MarR family transcriptional regulator